ncbi:Lipopolysaccharide kinase (Kdo/WaaP) family protein [Marinospirillum celere]|uniref:Lipopolysaccharide kinase (Kdo/WaaP) family protein n=1 Tax=Marinospirillum celere TaxID=1122252 RepID=A0A1I1EAL3_9GAMM|nr:lipopolysaccharide kinase InaA family protein [Marinospirillum celere]SFB84107.1 Lipopolysaccharide kinase (Kdo/WaaP) family protein [Marinospirillum celere]
MHQVQVTTFSNDADVPALLELGKRLLNTPAVQPENPDPAQSTAPKITHSLNKLLRAGHQIHFVQYQGREYIFKVFADLGQHSPGRRLGFFIDSWLKNPAEKSYQGACKLKELGIPAIEPVAHLSGRWGIHRRGLFIYESVQAQYSLKEWLNSDVSSQQRKESIHQLCQITRQLEASDYHFADFKLDNILVEENSDTNFRLVLIDTDEVLKSRLKKLAPLPKHWKKWLSLWHLRRLKPKAPLDMQFLKCHLAENHHPYDLGTWRLIRNFQPNPAKWLKRKKRKESRNRFTYRAYRITTHLPQEQAEAILDSFLDENYKVLATYKNSKRSCSQRVKTSDKQDLVFEQPQAQYQRLGYKIRNLFKAGEAVQQYSSMRLLQSLALQGPEALLAAEKPVKGLPKKGLVVYRHAEGEAADPDNPQHVKIIATALLHLHSYGYTRDDPRLNNYLINKGQPIFIDFLLEQPLLFRKTRLRMEFIKFLRRYPEAIEFLSASERTSKSFRLTQLVKNLGQRKKKSKRAKTP